MGKKFRIEVFERDGRLRARLVMEVGVRDLNMGEWWLTSKYGKRYKPLKPAPPSVHEILRMLPPDKVQDIGRRLLLAAPGDEIEFEVERL